LSTLQKIELKAKIISYFVAPSYFIKMETDNNLFKLIKQGDKQGFELLFKTYYAPLCVFARKYIKDTDDCEEVVQGFFLKLWDKRDTIEINTSVKSYLYSSVRNRSLNYIKHQKIKQEYHSEIISTTSEIDPMVNGFMEIGLIEKIDRTIAMLPPRRREIFLMSREQGLKYREIADQLGISIKTVETQMGHALKDLRDKLKEFRHLLITFFICKTFTA
jgi:RNA polymerase sigma-70 factor (ECF subfamily)